MPPKKATAKKTYKGKARTRAKPRSTYKPSKKEVVRMINRIMRRDVESKYSDVYEVDQEPLVLVSGAMGAIQQFQEPMSSWGFNLPQGVEQDQRIGNEIILREWIIKVAITPILAGEGIVFNTTPQLYVSFYVGYRKDYAALTNPLTGFFQNGNSSASPTGEIFDRLSYVNKDAYTILYQRKMKVGLAAPDATYAPYNGLSNNEFPLTQLFKFDMCQHGFKNLKLKYNDSALQPQDAKLNALYCWTLVTNANGLPLTNTVPSISTYDISITSQFKYEDP